MQSCPNYLKNILSGILITSVLLESCIQLPLSMNFDHGETEMKQVEITKSLHLRMGLTFDRLLLRIANAMDFCSDDGGRSESMRKVSTLLKDVHMGIPDSAVSGGSLSLVQGSYEYYHYLHDGFNDSGWGCAYRSIQTIILWFRLHTTPP